jgi:hypothetical protein
MVHRDNNEEFHALIDLEQIIGDGYVVGPFPKTRKGNQYILTICDCFTKWIEAFAMKDQESITIMEVLVDQFVCRFGTPMQLHSDQGTNFQSNAFNEMCDYLSIDKSKTFLVDFIS